MLEPLSAFEVPVLLIQVTVATAIGALIGLERERRSSRKFAGLRTMALLCGTGPVVVAVASAAGHPATMPVLLAMYLGLAVAVALSVAYVRFSLHGEAFGFTTSVTIVLVALLGVLVGFDRLLEGTAVAVLAAIVLAERDRLHGYVEGLTDREVRDSLKLGALVFVLYPILPGEAVDPYGVVVLRDVLLFAIFVLLIQFAAYVAMQTVGGSKGLAVTGLLAGMANSFAAAGVLADLADRSRAALDAASFALLLATVAMVVRNVAIASVLAADVLWLLVHPAVLMIAVTLVIAAGIWRTGKTVEDFGIDVDSPFSFRSAAKFSVAYVAILLISVGAAAAVGDAGLYATAFVGGLVSSAAVAVTAATVLTEGTVGPAAAAGMVLLGIVASLAAKIALVEATNRAMRRTASAPMGVVALTGVGAFVGLSADLPMIQVAVAGVITLLTAAGIVGLLVSRGYLSVRPPGDPQDVRPGEAK